MDDIVFSAYNEDRNITITLVEGSPLTMGKQHIIHNRPVMENKIDSIKYTIKNTDAAFRDKKHKDRERLYCLGADSVRPKMYTVVVVEYETENTGTVITAWQTSTIYGVGDITYVKSKK